MPPSLKDLVSIFGSHTKAQEILFLLHDLKPVVRQGFYGEELPAVEEFCKNNSLFLVKSKFKVILDGEDYFTNKGLRISETDPRWGMYFIYLSKDERKAHLASYYELINNHRELGQLLGYPECCADFFCQNFSDENTNPEIPSGNPYTNLGKRHEDNVLLSHFPCSAECTKSIELAQRHFALLQQNEPERAEELWRALSK